MRIQDCLLRRMMTLIWSGSNRSRACQVQLRLEGKKRDHLEALSNHRKNSRLWLSEENTPTRAPFPQVVSHLERDATWTPEQFILRLWLSSKKDNRPIRIYSDTFPYLSKFSYIQNWITWKAHRNSRLVLVSSTSKNPKLVTSLGYMSEPNYMEQFKSLFF